MNAPLFTPGKHYFETTSGRKQSKIMDSASNPYRVVYYSHPSMDYFTQEIAQIRNPLEEYGKYTDNQRILFERVHIISNVFSD